MIRGTKSVETRICARAGAASTAPGSGAVQTQTRRACGESTAQRLHCTEIVLAVAVASKISLDGQIGQVVPNAAGAFGSPCRANAARLCIIACDRASRPGRLAVEFAIFENSDGPKLPNKNGRSNACAAP